MSQNSEMAATNTADNEAEKRQRKLTEKARLLKLEKAALSRDVAYNRLRIRMKHMKEHMNQYDHATMLKEYSTWMMLYEDFQSEHDSYCSYLNKTELEEYFQEYYNEKEKGITEFKKMFDGLYKRNPQTRDTEPVKETDIDPTTEYDTNSHLEENTDPFIRKNRDHVKKRDIDSQKRSERKPDEESEVRPEDSISQYSRRSNRSRLSLEQSESLIEQKQRLLKEKEELEVLKVKLKYKQEILDLKEELADIRTANQDAISERSSKKSGRSSRSNCLNPLAQTFVPNNEDMTLKTLLQNIRRPVLEIKKFGGDSTEFKGFMRQFQTKIVNNTTTNDERMAYLQQYTYGQPNMIVSGHSHLDADVGFPKVLQEFEERYGDPVRMSNEFINKVLHFDPIKYDDYNKLDEFSILLTDCKNAASTIDNFNLDNPDNMKRLLSKLPFSMQDRWLSMLHNKDIPKTKVNFQTYVDFVKREARKANDPIYGRAAMKQYNNTKTPTAKTQQIQKSNNGFTKSRPKGSFATNLNDTKETCNYCKLEHSINMCKQFGNLKYDKRIEFLKSSGFCYGCLKRGHMKTNCSNKLSCDKCNLKHPTILHSDSKPTVIKVDKKDDKKTIVKDENSNSIQSSAVDGKNMGAGNDSEECTMAIVPVKVVTKNGLAPQDTYAFLDPGSNVSFISSFLLENLGLQGTKTRIKLDTMGDSITITSDVIKDLQIFSYDMSDSIIISKLYSKDDMPVNQNHIPTAKDVEQFPHLNGLPIYHPNCRIGLLIGNNVPCAYTPKKIITGPRNSPHASLTAIGYILWNVIRQKPSSNEFRTNFVNLISEYNHLNELDRMVRLSTEVEFPESTSAEKEEPSLMDKRFMIKAEESIKLVDNHYEVALPFKDPNIELPDNHIMVLNRLNNLKHKLQRNQEFYNDYITFMNSILENGYAEEIANDESAEADRNPKTWYLPHHGVYHKQKHKLRVVFDCSARYNGISLNDTLIGGPNLANNLVAVLLRFRIGKIGIMADIQAMFHQVKVPVKDRDSLRFYWWKNGNLETEPLKYRMTSHLFGAVSSPSIANYALRQTTIDFEDIFSTEVRNTVLTNFYVDDCLKSLDDKLRMIELIRELKEICGFAGFNLHKWVSNDQDVMDSVPECQRAVCLQPTLGDDPIVERALGVNWCVSTDSLTFKINVKYQPTTRRGLLSVISSIYDPLGFAAPALLPPKLLLQELCHKGLSWDEPINDKQKETWTRWLENLPTLEHVQIPRCFKSTNFGTLISAQLHSFSDACSYAYGVVCYLRLIDHKGQIVCSIVLGKSRVCPMKKITIPRLELTAATTSVKLATKIKDELPLDLEITYWTDSTTVLYYIANEESRYKTFVENRVSFIRECTDLSQWKYINTKDNPADEASRGLTVEKLVNSKRWFHGPEFLRKPEIEWPNNDISRKAPESIEIETKTTNTAIVDTDPIDKLLSYFSSYNKVKRAVVCLKWITQELKNRVERMKTQQNVQHKTKCIITASKLANAEEILLKHEQLKYFGDINDKTLKIFTDKQMMKLDPYNSNGILRVGGRIDRSAMDLDSKHQIILPKQSRLSELLIQHTHQQVGHLGKNSILAELRKRYWIIGASSIIKRIVSRCVTCKRHSHKTNEQKMANLPAERLQPNGLPFEYTGMDFFGPFEITQRRTVVKRYGVIFSCFNTRAVHIEIAHSLDTDSCINAIRRFISRRGKPRLIRSDNGTNLVGAEKELRQAIYLWDDSRITEALAKQSIEWRFNVPAASHHGGVWERIIRTIRKVLFSLQRDQISRLTDESLVTLMCECESIINNRPLTKLSDSPNDLDSLTPNHLLLAGHNAGLAPIPFSETNVYMKQRWKRVQYLTDLFWKRWTQEYLPTLQERKKWLHQQRNVKKGDIVMIFDNSLRNSWTLARVIGTKMDKHGLVRSATLKTQTSTLDRPITKLCTLLEADF